MNYDIVLFDIRFYFYQVFQKIKKAINRIIYFVHHLSRCKKPEDMIKLLVMVICEILETTILVMEARQNAFNMLRL